ncbi:hypothetical protein EBS80_02355 [bacterium]|nr:hypothetical protein [bacterium]
MNERASYFGHESARAERSLSPENRRQVLLVQRTVGMLDRIRENLSGSPSDSRDLPLVPSDAAAAKNMGEQLRARMLLLVRDIARIVPAVGIPRETKDLLLDALAVSSDGSLSRGTVDLESFNHTLQTVLDRLSSRSEHA